MEFKKGDRVQIISTNNSFGVLSEQSNDRMVGKKGVIKFVKKNTWIKLEQTGQRIDQFIWNPKDLCLAEIIPADMFEIS